MCCRQGSKIVIAQNYLFKFLRNRLSVLRTQRARYDICAHIATRAIDISLIDATFYQI